MRRGVERAVSMRGFQVCRVTVALREIGNPDAA
jgi:hypothetical protein